MGRRWACANSRRAVDFGALGTIVNGEFYGRRAKKVLIKVLGGIEAGVGWANAGGRWLRVPLISPILEEIHNPPARGWCLPSVPPPGRAVYPAVTPPEQGSWPDRMPARISRAASQEATHVSNVSQIGAPERKVMSLANQESSGSTTSTIGTEHKSFLAGERGSRGGGRSPGRFWTSTLR